MGRLTPMCDKYVRILHTCDKYEMWKIRFNSTVLELFIYTERLKKPDTYALVFVNILVLNEITVHLYFPCLNLNSGSLRRIELF